MDPPNIYHSVLEQMYLLRVPGRKIPDVVILSIACVHLIPLTSYMSLEIDFAHDVCKSENPKALMLLQFMFSLLLIVGVFKKEPHYVFPFMCMHFTMYVFFIPYNFIEIVPKNVPTPRFVTPTPAKRVDLFLFGTTCVMVIITGILLHTYYERLLETKYLAAFGITEINLGETETEMHGENPAMAELDQVI